MFIRLLIPKFQQPLKCASVAIPVGICAPFLLSMYATTIPLSEAVAAGGDSIIGREYPAHQPAKFGEPNRAIPHRDTASDSPFGPSTRDKASGKNFEGGQVYPIPELEPVSVIFSDSGDVVLSSLPPLKTKFLNRVAGISERDEFVFYTLDPKLQAYAERLVHQAKAPHVAVVAMEPDSGKILAIAEKSNSIRNLSLHAGFPAASLFKVVTASAALEQGLVEPESRIPYRGGTYTLERWNYKPDARRDRRSMTMAEALGRSCNPVFGRIALRFLEPKLLNAYAQYFGFNSPLEFDTPLTLSSASIPSDDYGFSRTAAGFGSVNISPLHAATLMAGIANAGLMPRPSLVDRVITKSGTIRYHNQTEILQRVVRPETAEVLLRMMHITTTIGTSRKEFMFQRRPAFPGIKVAAKTGTLRGDNPEGINNWFIGAAPLENPKIAVSVIVVNPSGSSSKASHIGREILEKFFEIESS